MRLLFNTWDIMKVSFLAFSVANMEVQRGRMKMKSKSYKGNFFLKPLGYSEMRSKGGEWSSQGCCQDRGRRMSNQFMEA
jgi:hypothetical protein